MRTAIGATRARIVRQLLIEHLLLSLAGGVVGLLLCSWEVEAVKTVAGRDMTILSDLVVDGRVLLFAFSLALVCPLFFGLAPALRSSRVDIRGGLKEAWRRSRAAGADDGCATCWSGARSRSP